MNYRIETDNLSKQFGTNTAVDQINLQIGKGEIYGLVGPDGAGKTTLMRLLCGALLPSSGTATVKGFNMQTEPEKGREHIGYLAQRFSLYDELTVIENLRFFAEVRGIPSNEWKPRCLDILHFVGMDDFIDRRAGKLSGGMRQKLGLAAALIHQPDVLLLDEPTTGVDPVTRQDFWQLIISLVAEQEISILVSTPYMDEAARCMRLAFIRDGKLLMKGSPDELRDTLKDQIIEIKGQPAKELLQIAVEDKNVLDAQLFGELLHVRVKEGKQEKTIKRLKKDLKVVPGFLSIRSVAPNLEDVFIALQELDYQETNNMTGAIL